MEVIGIILILYAIYLYIKSNIVLKQNKLDLKKKDEVPHIAILIPARDESSVIETLLKSIQNQTISINPEDVYVIVETIKDPTVEICHCYQNTVIVRENLENQRKGYALDEAMKQILPKKYDLYFIFDADNVLKEDYIEKMLDSYYQGYEIATGYRMPKNGNDNVIAAVSSLTFSMINTLGNLRRIKENANVIISGTGYYIDGSLMEKWSCFPFHSLTEDYELSLYAIQNAIPTYYNESAIFYDEQPTQYKQTVNQRIRWIKGYFSARRKYIPLMKKKTKNSGSVIKEKIGVKPFVFLIIGFILIFIQNLIRLIHTRNSTFVIISMFLVFFLIYFSMMLVTIYMMKKEKYEFSKDIKWKVVIINPLYLVTYIPCAIKAILKKNVTWKKIEHGSFF